MVAIAPIDFEKDVAAPINFLWKQGSKGILHQCIEILNGLLGIPHPSIEIPNDAPASIPANWWFTETNYQVSIMNFFMTSIYLKNSLQFKGLRRFLFMVNAFEIVRHFHSGLFYAL